MIVKINGEAVQTFNPIGNITNSIAELNEKIDTFFYWINPKNLFHEGYEWLLEVLQSPTTATFIICATIVGIMAMMLGAESPKKVLFWTWIIYFVLKMVLL